MKKKRDGDFEEKMSVLNACEDIPEIGAMIYEISQLAEAAENYRLAPMNIKRYYLMLYYDLLKKYNGELIAFGSELSFRPECTEISLYQDAGAYFLKLRDSLTDIALGRVSKSRSKGA